MIDDPVIYRNYSRYFIGIPAYPAYRQAGGRQAASRFAARSVKMKTKLLYSYICKTANNNLSAFGGGYPDFKQRIKYFRNRV